MFGTSGIRGRVGTKVTAQLALDIGRAVAVDTDRVVVGRDPRESGKTLLDALTAGLRESGTDVVDMGMAATPTVARAVAWEDADAGAVITASHNPATDNGIKLWQRSGQAFDSALQTTIEQRITDGETALVPWNEFGTRTRKDGTARHKKALVDAVEINRSLSVVVDVGNGAGGVTAEALAELGCTVETLNAQPDGSFPGRPSEPTPEHCESLSALLKTTDAEVGIAHDGDADRMRAVTEDGEFLSGDVLLAVLARESADAGEKVAVPVDTSLAVADYLAAAGIETVRTRVGDVYVAEATTQSGVVFGGEPSGAWIWPTETRCPDGPLAACKLVSLASKRSLAERAAKIETYPIRRVAIPVADKARRMETIAKRIEDEGYGDVSTLDGIRVTLEDGWFLIRPSGTESVVRITAEARAERRVETLFTEAKAIVSG